jgi:hypothetical protein
MMGSPTPATDADRSVVSPGSDVPLPEFEKQTYAPVFKGVLDEYTELMIQYGYVTLFACAFPLSSMCALINNIVEVRIDGFKLLYGTQRPVYRGAEDIGTWLAVLETMSVLSVVSNCAIIAFTSGVFRGEPANRDGDGYEECVTDCQDLGLEAQTSFTEFNASDWLTVSNSKSAMVDFTTCLDDCSCTTAINTCYSLVTRIWIFILAEHMIIGAKIIIALMIPDKPAFVAQAEARANVERSLASFKPDETKMTPEQLKEWETREAEETVWDREGA